MGMWPRLRTRPRIPEGGHSPELPSSSRGLSGPTLFTNVARGRKNAKGFSTAPPGPDPAASSAASSSSSSCARELSGGYSNVVCRRLSLKEIFIWGQQGTAGISARTLSPGPTELGLVTSRVVVGDGRLEWVAEHAISPSETLRGGGAAPHHRRPLHRDPVRPGHQDPRRAGSGCPQKSRAPVSKHLHPRVTSPGVTHPSQRPDPSQHQESKASAPPAVWQRPWLKGGLF